MKGKHIMYRLQRFATVIAATIGIAALSASGETAQLIIATSDYFTGNTATYDIGSDTFAPNMMGHADQDVSVHTDGTSVYFLEKQLGAVSKFNPQSMGPSNYIYQYSAGPTTNPCDIVFFENKAYVLRYQSGSILIINQNATSQAEFEKGTIDLSMFDTDGISEMQRGFAIDGRVYVLLQRLHNYVAEQKGLLVAIDPTTDTVVDLDSATPGVQGRELLVKNPQFCSLVGNMLYIGGHIWTGQTEGVQTIDTGDPLLPQTMLISEAPLFMDVTGMTVFNEQYGIVASSRWLQDNSGNWYQQGTATWFNPSTGALGAVLPVPSPDGGAVMVDGTAYIGSRSNTVAGIYPVNPSTNLLTRNPLLTTLPPYSMIALGGTTTTVENTPESVPAPIILDAPFPNPFNPETALRLTMNVQSHVRIEVFALNGQRVATLADANMPTGVHRIVWNAEGMPSGSYIFRVSSGSYAESAKITLLK
jgi:hypothetical protein